MISNFLGGGWQKGGADFFLGGLTDFVSIFFLNVYVL